MMIFQTLVFLFQPTHIPPRLSLAMALYQTFNDNSNDNFIWTQITSHTTDRGHDGFNDGVVSTRLLLLPYLRPGPRPVVVLKHLQTSKTDWSVRHNTSSLSFFELSVPPIRTVFWFKGATLRPVSFLGKFRLVPTLLIVKMAMIDY